MGAIRTHTTKNGRNAPINIENPSFVYRQDGYELSYSIGEIIPFDGGFVKGAGG